MEDFSAISTFVRVVEAKSFAAAASQLGMTPSGVSRAVARLETQLGTRLLSRSTRSLRLTDDGASFHARCKEILADLTEATEALGQARIHPVGKLRVAAHSAIGRSAIIPNLVEFEGRYPDIRLEVIVEDGFVDVLAAGCDAGVRYDERLEQDMIAVPIGPRVQRFATAASPAYLDAHGRPEHPRDLLAHACLRGQFASGAKPTWEFERDGDVVRIDPVGPLVVQPGGAVDLVVGAAVAGLGVIHLFEEWLRPHLDSGALEPVLAPWWQSFSGPFLYYPGRRHLPAPLRAFVDFIKT